MTEQPLVLTCGDPAGVGPEVVEAWLVANPASRAVVAGHPDWLELLRKKTGGWVALPVAAEQRLPCAGKPNEEGALIAWAALEAAASAVQAGRCAAAVTAPISKLWMNRIGYTFPGQTEFFAERWGGEPVMAFGGERMRVVLATWHIPLMAVATALNEEVLERALRAAWQLGQAAGITSPRVGVCGLNPHAGEGGILGTEERDWVDGWLASRQSVYPGLSMTQPSDTLFWRHLQGEFDVVVALYHDQGLIPLKTVEFDSAANLTLGLPYVRTSPDHGTAYALAGKGRASATSFHQAAVWASRLVDAALRRRPKSC